MKGIILYASRYGATRRYADWLAEETGFARVETRSAGIEEVRQCDTVVLGGGVYASGIEGIAFLRKHIGALRGKRVIVFCVGASPYDEAAFRQLVARNLKDSLADLPCFYCRGSLNMDRMGFFDRNLCRMLRKAVAKKPPEERTPLEQALMEAGDRPRDWTDRSFLAPILEAVRQTADP